MGPASFRVVVAPLLVALGVGVGGCDRAQPDPAETMAQCEAGATAWAASVGQVLGAHAACTVDADCTWATEFTLAEMTLTCPGQDVTVSLCPHPVAVTAADAARADLDALRAAACATMPPICVSVASCPDGILACDGTACTVSFK